MPEITCATCSFCEHIDDEDGICRADPPTLVMKETPEGWQWPCGEWPRIALNSDWCGRHPAIQKDVGLASLERS